MPFLHLERPPTWVVQENDWQPAHNGVWEARCALANGYLGVRGYPEEPFTAGPTQPDIYLAGVFAAGADGVPEVVRLPNLLAVEILLDGRPFRLRPGRVTEYARVLGMKRGLLQRSLVYTERGRSTRLEFERFVSLADPHLIGQSLTVTPLDWRGSVTVRLWLDARARHQGPRLRLVHAEHLGRDRLLLATQTAGATFRIAHACRCSCWVQQGAPARPEPVGCGARRGFEFAVALEPGQPAAFERLMATYTSRDPDTDSAERGCLEAVRGSEGGAYGVRRRQHVQAWHRRWERADIVIYGGPAADQRALRFAIFHLLQHAPPPRLPVSTAAQGLSGRGHHGHVFWDTEIFILPFFLATDPLAARRLLQYRLTTLPGAVRKGRAAGFQGALFAWESADTGDEACPEFVPDPKTGAPMRVFTGEMQHHISAAIAYAAWHYAQATQDTAYRERELLTLTVATARFWASRVECCSRYALFVIRRVVGPDDYHPGVNNNAYTNYLAAWNLRLAAAEVDRMRRVHARSHLLRQLAVSRAEAQAWRRVAAQLYQPKVTAGGVWEQHQGFFRLRQRAAPPLAALASPLPNGSRLARIRRAQVIKQADVLMLPVLFPRAFSIAWRKANWAFYEPRTIHDSPLSFSAHAIVACDLGQSPAAYEYFRRGAFLDLDDGLGDTAAGLHLAALGGTWQTVVRGFLGWDDTGRRPRFRHRPRLPASWLRLTLHLQHRGRWYRVEATSASCRLIACASPSAPGVDQSGSAPGRETADISSPSQPPARQQNRETPNGPAQ